MRYKHCLYCTGAVDQACSFPGIHGFSQSTLDSTLSKWAKRFLRLKDQEKDGQRHPGLLLASADCEFTSEITFQPRNSAKTSTKFCYFCVVRLTPDTGASYQSEPFRGV